MPSMISSLLLTGAALLVVLGLIWLAQHLARLGGLLPRQPGGNRLAAQLAVEAAIALDARRRVHLLRCDDRHVLLLTGGAQDVVVGWLPGEGREP